MSHTSVLDVWKSEMQKNTNDIHAIVNGRAAVDESDVDDSVAIDVRDDEPMSSSDDDDDLAEFNDFIHDEDEASGDATALPDEDEFAAISRRLAAAAAKKRRAATAAAATTTTPATVFVDARPTPASDLECFVTLQVYNVILAGYRWSCAHERFVVDDAYQHDGARATPYSDALRAVDGSAQLLVRSERFVRDNAKFFAGAVKSRPLLGEWASAHFHNAVNVQLDGERRGSVVCAGAWCRDGRPLQRTFDFTFEAEWNYQLWTSVWLLAHVEQCMQSIVRELIGMAVAAGGGGDAQRTASDLLRVALHAKAPSICTTTSQYYQQARETIDNFCKH